MKKKPQYQRVERSKSFRNREEASKWADQQKDKYGAQGVSVKKEINYDEKTQRWTAQIFIKSDGARSVDAPGSPRQPKSRS